MTDTVELSLNDLSVSCVIGDRPDERTHPQTIAVDATLELVMPRGAASLEETADYVSLAENIRRVLQDARCILIEQAASLVCETCLAAPCAVAARARVTKSGTVPGLGSASATVSRRR